MLNKLSSNRAGIMSVIIGSIFLGGVGILVRFASDNVQPMMQTFGRLFIAFLLITALNLAKNKLKKETFAINKKDLPIFLLNGLVGFSLMAAAFTLSILNTSITNTYFLLYTAPVFAAILGALFLKEKISKNLVISIAIGIVGLALLFNPQDLMLNFTGNIYGLVTGISFGAYFVITGYLGKKYNSATITFWTQFFGSIGIIPLILIFDSAPHFNFSLSDWVPIIIAGVVVLCGYYLLNHGLTKIKASVGSVLSLFEPLSSIFYGFIFFTEVPETYTVIGALLILSAIIYLTYNQKDK